MRFWLKFRIWRSAVGRYLYLGLLGFVVMFGMNRTGVSFRQERSWGSITAVGEDRGRFVIVSSANAMIVQRGNRESLSDDGEVEKNNHAGWRRDIAGMPRLSRGEERLNNGKEHSWDTYKRGDYLLEPTDPHIYTQMNTPRNVCFDQQGRPYRVPMIVFVTSALGNLKRRDHIRVTYGSNQAWKILNQTIVRTVFMLGTTNDPLLQSKINAEASIYGDIVQEDFIDSYLNLTRKTVMGLKWVTEHCRHAKFAMKIDDDTMLNKARILEFILQAPSRGVVMGNVNLDIPVVRSRQGEWGKYRISKNFYPASTYPPYLSGPAVIMSTDLVEATFRAALTTPLFPWEDVFMGMCLKKIGVSLMHDYHFMCTSKTEECYSDKEWPKYAVFIDLPAEYMVRVWVESSMYADKQLPNVGK